MSRCKDAPCGFECPFRHHCPHLDTMSTTWVMQVYQESFELQDRLNRLEEESRQRIEELEKTLLERDAKIAQLRLAHQKQFKANVKPAPVPIQATARRRGAPVGHPGWRRRAPDHVDQFIDVPAPEACPHCQCTDLEKCSELHEHVQEDVVLLPRTRVTKYVHQQRICPLPACGLPGGGRRTAGLRHRAGDACRGHSPAL
jgi:transposase